MLLSNKIYEEGNKNGRKINSRTYKGASIEGYSILGKGMEMKEDKIAIIDFDDVMGEFKDK